MKHILQDTAVARVPNTKWVELRREVSPDGLVFVVGRAGSTIIMGFEGSACHTLHELLSLFNGDLEGTALAVVDDLLADRMLMLRQTDDEGPFGLCWLT